MTEEAQMASTAAALARSIAERERWERDRQVVLAQLHNLMLALRSNAKFSSRERYAASGKDREHQLTRAARDLREALFSPAANSELSSEQLLAPFISVAVSDETTEPITGVALAAFVAFLELKCTFLTPASLVHMCDAARKSRSEVTDIQSHEAVLARILQVFVGCARHPAAVAVPAAQIVSVLESAFAIACQGEPSELLRRTAEQAMSDVVAAVFDRVASASSDAHDSCSAPVLEYVCRLITCDARVVGIAGSGAASSSARNSAALAVSAAAVQLQGLCLAHTVLFILKDALRLERCRALMECVRNDLCRALLRVGGRIDNIVVLSQLLRTAHLVVQFASTEVVPQVLSLLQHIHLRPVSRRLLGAGRPGSGSNNGGRGGSSPVTSTPLSPLPPSRSFTALDEDDLQEQNEMLLESLLEFCSEHAFPTFVFYHYDLSTRYPNLLEELSLFLSRNCFHAGSTLQPAGGAAHLATGGSPTAGGGIVFPASMGAAAGSGGGGGNGGRRPLNQINMLALDALMAMLSSVAERVQAFYARCQDAINEMRPHIAERAQRKQRLIQFAKLFAQDPPKAAIKFLRTPPEGQQADCFGIAADCSGWDIGEFLFRHKALLDKTSLGDYIGDLGKEPLKPTEADDPDGSLRQKWEDDRYEDYKKFDTVRFYEAQLKGFMNCFNFTGKPLLQSIREMVFEMRLPGESQKIDRVMQAFAVHWYSSNKDSGPEINPFRTEDAAFILSFSIIMLNTDLHSGKLEKTMTVDGFKSMNRGIDQGENVPDAYLEGVYLSVKAQQIIMIDMVQEGCEYDISWTLEVSEAEHEARRHGPIAGMRGSANHELVAFDESTFAVLWRPCVAALATVLDACGSSCVLSARVARIEDLAKVFPREAVIFQCALRGFELCARTACTLGNTVALDHVVLSLVRLVPLQLLDGHNHAVAAGRSAKALLAAKLLFSVLRESGGCVHEAWHDVGALVHAMHLLGVFSPELCALDAGAAAAAGAGAASSSGGAGDGPVPAGVATPARGQGVPLNTTISSSPEQLPGSPYTLDSPVEELMAVPDTLRRNPGIVHLARARGGPGSTDGGGWFSGWFGSNEAAEQKRVERQREEAAALRRLQLVCPTVEEFLAMTAALPDAALALLLNGLIAAGSLQRNDRADAFTAAHNVHLVVEVAVQNLSRLHVLRPALFAYLEELALAAFTFAGEAESTAAKSGSAEDKRKAGDWQRIVTRVVDAVLRLVAVLRRRHALHEAMFELVAHFAALPPSLFGASAASPLSVTLYELIVEPHIRDAGVPPFSCANALTWDRLLFAAHAICATAPYAEVRARGLAILTTIARLAPFDVLANSQRLARALFSVAMSPPVTVSEAAQNSWIAQFDYNPLAHIATPAVPVAAHVDVVRAALEGICEVHARLAVRPQEASDTWLNAWHECLRALTVLSLTSPTTDACVAALRALQRCILDPSLLSLEPRHYLVVFEEVIFPLVESVCHAAALDAGAAAVASGGPTHGGLRHPTMAGAPGAAASFLSPTALMSAVFGPLAGPERGGQGPAAAADRGSGDAQPAAATGATPSSSSSSSMAPDNGSGSGSGSSSGTAYPAALAPSRVAVGEEIESQAALLLDKAFLHFFTPLAQLPTEEFVALWRRILGTLYAMYTLHGASRAASRAPAAFDNTQESIRQHVTNIIMVITTPEEQPQLNAHPAFWAATRQGLRAFDFCEPLLRHLDTCSFAHPQ